MRVFKIERVILGVPDRNLNVLDFDPVRRQGLLRPGSICINPAEGRTLIETQTQLRAANTARKGRKRGDRVVLSKALVLTIEQATIIVAEQAPVATVVARASVAAIAEVTKKRHGRPLKVIAVAAAVPVVAAVLVVLVAGAAKKRCSMAIRGSISFRRRLNN